MKRGMTLAEILIVVVILAVLAAVALPNYSALTHKTRANRAVAYLRVIRAAEKMHFAKNGVYIPCATPNCGNTLGIDISEEDYDFSVVTSAANPAAVPPTPAGFTATAARGGVAANFISINQNGDFGSGGTCAQYQPAN